MASIIRKPALVGWFVLALGLAGFGIFAFRQQRSLPIAIQNSAKAVEEATVVDEESLRPWADDGNLKHGDSAKDFRRIKPGMTRADMEATFGPPGDYRSGPTTADGWVWMSGGFVGWARMPNGNVVERNVPAASAIAPAYPGTYPRGTIICLWKRDTGHFWVTFDPGGSAVSATMYPGERRGQGNLERSATRDNREYVYDPSKD
jgi:hypothetical protein